MKSALTKENRVLIIPLLCSLKCATRNVRGQASYPRKGAHYNCLNYTSFDGSSFA